MPTILILGGGGLLLLLFGAFLLTKQPTPVAKNAEPTILVIDDNVCVLGVVQMGLENEGYAVLSASSPQDGLDIFRKHSQDISLVLLDYCMPGMNGQEVFDCLQQIDEDVSVLVITGFGEKLDEARQFRNNVKGYMVKPFQLNELVGKVREVVRQA